MDSKTYIINNVQHMQFKYIENGERAYLTYRFYKQSIAFLQTVVPDSFRGKGIASALAKHAFSFAAEQEKKVMVYCHFVSAYVKKHPEVLRQLNPTFHQNL